MLETPTRIQEGKNKEIVSARSNSLHSRHSRLAIMRVVVIVVISCLALTGFVKLLTRISAGTEIDITNGHFSQNTLVITEGTTVHFKNVVQTNSDEICIGQNAQCLSSGDGPSSLYNQGILIASGQTVDVTFNTPSTYSITNLFNSSANLIVEVDKVQDSTDSNASDNDSNDYTIPKNITVPSNTNSSLPNNTYPYYQPNTNDDPNMNGTQPNSNDDGSNVTSPSGNDSNDENVNSPSSNDDGNSNSSSSDDSGSSSGGDDGGDSGGGGGDGGDSGGGGGDGGDGD